MQYEITVEMSILNSKKVLNFTDREIDFVYVNFNHISCVELPISIHEIYKNHLQRQYSLVFSNTHLTIPIPASKETICVIVSSINDFLKSGNDFYIHKHNYEYNGFDIQTTIMLKREN